MMLIKIVVKFSNLNHSILLIKIVFDTNNDQKYNVDFLMG